MSSSVPSEIPGFGSATTAPRQNLQFRPGADFTSEDYFVFSRCDGNTAARSIVLSVGLGTERACAILARLRAIGAILLPGEATRTPPPTTAPPPARRRPTDPRRDEDPPGPAGVDPAAPTAEEAAALIAPVDLPEPERRRIIEVARLAARGSELELLGVPPSADRKALKRAYFKMSKEFHPDRFYNRQLGPFRAWLTQIFERVVKAYETLDAERARNPREDLRGLAGRPRETGGGQGRTEQAAELFARACAHEVRGELPEALRLFALTVRSDPQARYLRRAALCALAARDLSAAEEYARQGTELRRADPAYARVLAEVLGAAGKLAEAETTLVAALELRSENDTLGSELRAALAAVRAALTSSR